jgi:hypothetical protein
MLNGTCGLCLLFLTSGLFSDTHLPACSAGVTLLDTRPSCTNIARRLFIFLLLQKNRCHPLPPQATRQSTFTPELANLLQPKSKSIIPPSFHALLLNFVRLKILFVCYCLRFLTPISFSFFLFPSFSFSFSSSLSIFFTL